MSYVADFTHCKWYLPGIFYIFDVCSMADPELVGIFERSSKEGTEMAFITMSLIW